MTKLAPGDWINLCATVFAAGTVVVAILTWRKAQLRHSEVLHWSNAAIEALRSLYIVLGRDIDTPECPARAKDLQIQISVVCEQGRILFKNTEFQGRDANIAQRHKPDSYRGIRPTILDQLIVGYDVVSEWHGADTELRQDLLAALNIAQREFVSLSQFEVGRSRTASKAPSKPGRGSPLTALLAVAREDRKNSER